MVSYFRRKLSAAKRNYCVTRKELLGGGKEHRTFPPLPVWVKLTGRTDHAVFRWFTSRILKNLEEQLARWISKLEEQNYSTELRLGRVCSDADSLSRRLCFLGLQALQSL